MSNLTDIVVGVIAANGGEIVGKTRLQKTIFLLESCGLGCGLDFDYHYYGPYSAELAEAADDAVAAQRLSFDERPGYHSVPYTVFRSNETVPRRVGDMPKSELSQKLEVLGRYSAIELELAATIVYLKGSKDVLEKVASLKPLKATPDRLRNAQQLIRELDIS